MILLMGAEKESDDLARLQKSEKETYQKTKIQSANFIRELISNQTPKYYKTEIPDMKVRSHYPQSTPPRTPRISRLKSQILKPTLLS